jgi:hypothetical protein
LQQEDQKSDEIDKAGKGIVPDRIYLSVCDLQNVHLDYSHNLLPLATLQWYEIIPSRKLIADESPVYAYQEIEEENKSCYKMDKPHSAEPIIEICFCAFHESRWVPDNITRNTK